MSLNACRMNGKACPCPLGCKRSEGARSPRPGGLLRSPYGCAPQATYQVAQCPGDVRSTSEGVESCAAAWRGYHKDKSKTKRQRCEKAAHKQFAPHAKAKSHKASNDRRVK